MTGWPMHRQRTITQLDTCIGQLQRAQRNLLDSLECTDAGVRELTDKVKDLACELHVQRQVSRSYCDRLDDLTAPMDAQSDSSDSVGRSADLRTHIAAVIRREVPCHPPAADRIADAVIRELKLDQNVDFTSVASGIPTFDNGTADD